MKFAPTSLLAFFVITITSSQAFADTALFAAKELQLNSAVPDETEFTRPFEDPLPARLANSEQLVQLSNCRDYLAVRSQIIGSDNENDYKVLIFQTVPCIALALLQSSSVAKNSALPEDFLSYTNTAFYPATLWPAVSDNERENPDWSTGNLWSYTQQTALRKTDNGKLELEKSGWGLRFSLLARGDFNHDGWEDAAFQWQGYALHNSYADSRLVILTRTDEQTVFIELPVDQLLLK